MIPRRRWDLVQPNLISPHYPRAMFTKSSLLLALTGGALVAAAPQGFQSTDSACAQVSKQYAKAVESNGEWTVVEVDLGVSLTRGRIQTQSSWRAST